MDQCGTGPLFNSYCALHSEGHIKQKVLNTKAVYESQTGLVVHEINCILEDFQINTKFVAATVDNASNMDVALKNLKLLNVGCFAHTLNLAAQKVYSINDITKWCARLRSIVVWLRRSSIAKIGRSSNFSVSSVVIIYIRKLCLCQTSSSVDCNSKFAFVFQICNNITWFWMSEHGETPFS